MNLRRVLRLLGQLVLVLAGALTVPAAVCLIYGEDADARAFAWTAALTAACALAMRAAGRRAEAADFYRRGDVSDVTGYRVSAWAAPAVRPSGPKRWKYPATALLLGAVASFGLLKLRQRYRRDAVVSLDDVEKLFPDAAVVPMVIDATTRGGRRRAWVREAALAGYVFAMVGVSAWFVAAHRGWVPAPEWMRPFLGHLA